MFDPDSRYAPIETATHVMPDGREVRFVRRRFVPPADAGATLAEHPTTEGDRLDNVTARYLGDPLAFWRVCDANLVVHPAELTDEIGRRIRIALAAP